jgi:hypothetical protein
MLGIMYHGTKIEANSRNSVLNHSAEEKTTQNFVPWNKNTSNHLEFCSEPILRKRKQLGILFRGTKLEENSRNSVPKHASDKNMLTILYAGPGFFVKVFFFMTFPSLN